MSWDPNSTLHNAHSPFIEQKDRGGLFKECRGQLAANCLGAKVRVPIIKSEVGTVSWILSDSPAFTAESSYSI